ncbi:aconitate hydratase AcnA [Salinicoccus sp. ID82-1]|uniref:aconitate hydratase AcnA n=1 Tax=Salinicoccus sp. ID82-1 TaxID=2820269 RepID=UPI001F0130C3|nr:aconitate hydratase AcnA [Salinicoccus sp. ID82-1]MCG1009651.1 aconitate hydratase AcnA [Salinicoccus sp. ID82-1]
MDRHLYLKSFKTDGQTYHYYSLKNLAEQYGKDVEKLPYALRIILESSLRNFDGQKITKKHIEPLVRWGEEGIEIEEVSFKPHRILFHDTTGVPAIVDMALLRDHAKDMGADLEKVNPVIPIDLVIDHSLIVDASASERAIELNEQREFDRNEERFQFLKWAQESFDNFRVFPPSSGIMHQINLEYISEVVRTREEDGMTIVYPDSLVGADSHTTMINGLGIFGYGVGGIEAEAAMLGEAMYLGAPKVVGVELSGRLPEGSTATDLALTITHLLRKHDVVGKIVEFHGEGVQSLTVFDRSTVSNMAPEYGATMSYFPVDKETLDYLETIGKDQKTIRFIKDYYQEQNLFFDANKKDPIYSEHIQLDLNRVTPSISGPKRPQDRADIKEVKENFEHLLKAAPDDGGYGIEPSVVDEAFPLPSSGSEKLTAGSIVLASITSCTNTSNPDVLVGAGILARNAVERGLTVPSYVKTSFTPGSKVVTEYMKKSELQDALNILGFGIVGYGCATCIGNSGDLLPEADRIVDEENLVVSSILSGNRNFEGRVHPKVRANYLGSPPLVVAYALAGRIDIDFDNEPISKDNSGNDVYLKDLWPTSKEVEAVKKSAIDSTMFKKSYDDIMVRNERWNNLTPVDSRNYSWDRDSTYIQKPPFLNEDLIPDSLEGSRILLMLGDSVTTDHISPSGRIKVDGPAGNYLSDKGVSPRAFNSYPSRRGNYLVMERAAFANVRVRNRLVPDIEGGFTRYLPTGEVMDVFEAAQKYKDDGTPLTIIAGKEYGTGSSRDWAAKGTMLLGVRTVIAESFERIHRSNLICMGVLPLQFEDGENQETLGIKGTDKFHFSDQLEALHPGKIIEVRMEQGNEMKYFKAKVRLDNQAEVIYYKHGGILPYIADGMVSKKK